MLKVDSLGYCRLDLCALPPFVVARDRYELRLSRYGGLPQLVIVSSVSPWLPAIKTISLLTEVIRHLLVLSIPWPDLAVVVSRAHARDEEEVTLYGG